MRLLTALNLLVRLEVYQLGHFDLLCQTVTLVKSELRNLANLELQRIDLGDCVHCSVDGVVLLLANLASFDILVDHAFDFFDDYLVSVLELVLESLLESDHTISILVFLDVFNHDFLQLLSIFINDYELTLLTVHLGSKSSEVVEDFTEQTILASMNESSVSFSANVVYIE